MRPVSKHLSSRQIRGINGIGDVLLPGAPRKDGREAFPPFSETGCVRHVDRILDYMPAQDLSDLKLLLWILGWLPSGAVRWFVNFVEKSPQFNNPLGPILRLIRLGLRGLIMTLYYGDEQIHRRMGYEVRVQPKS